MDIQETKYIAYYRVSTQQQGKSGLGLEAQKQAIKVFARHNIYESFTDIESGKRSDNRPELTKAIDLCLKTGAKLIIAKLDRLSRNVEFIAKLMNSKVDFVACDMPEADRFTIHIFAALAEREREMISKRTKESLQALKTQGKQLGGPNCRDKSHTDHMRSRRKPKVYDAKLLSEIGHLNNESLKQVATRLNDLGYRTHNGNLFTAVHVHRIKKRCSNS